MFNYSNKKVESATNAYYDKLARNNTVDNFKKKLGGG